MATPFPPGVSGPVTQLSTQIQVNNVLPGSAVTVYDDLAGTHQVGKTTSTAGGGSIWVPLSTKVAKNGWITARQEYVGKPDPMIKVTGQSGPTPKDLAVPVQPVPDPLPSPSYQSGLSQCMDTVWMGGLIPGANLKISLGGTTLFDGQVTTEPQYIGLTPSPSGYTIGASLEAVQSAPGVKPSPAVPSGPIQAPPTKLLPPVIDPVPAACQTSISASSLTPGADLKITVFGGAELFFPGNVAAEYLSANVPLPKGAATAQQYFTRCQNPPPSTPTNFTIETQAPTLPTVPYPPCTDVTLLEVDGLTGGEILTVVVYYETTGGKIVDQLLGQQGVSGDSSPVPLPSGWYPSDASGAVQLRIGVSLCETPLKPPGYLPVTVGQPGGPFPAPSIGPLYCGAGSVIVAGAHIGTVLQIFSVPASDPTAPPTTRSSPKVATSDPISIGLWWPLTANESIFATQQGCTALSPSNSVTVISPPVPFKGTGIVQPRPGATTVEVTGVLPGAQVYLIVSGVQVAIENAPNATPSSMLIPTGKPLANQETVEAFQVVCGQKSSIATSVVMIGKLALTIHPPELIRGKANALLIQATDSTTGASVSGLPVTIAAGFTKTTPITPTGSSSSGVTGSAFDYTPDAHQSSAEAFVAGAPGYEDAYLVDITLWDPLAVWYRSIGSGSAIVMGSGFADRYGSNTCSVTLSETEPLGSTITLGPFSGDIAAGIPVTLQCVNPGQYYYVSVKTATGFTFNAPNLSCP